MQYVDFSLQWFVLLQSTGSIVVAHGLSCSKARGIFLPGPGIKPVSPVLAGRFLTTGPLREVLSFHPRLSRWDPHTHLCLVFVLVFFLFYTRRTPCVSSRLMLPFPFHSQTVILSSRIFLSLLHASPPLSSVVLFILSYCASSCSFFPPVPTRTSHPNCQ